MHERSLATKEVLRVSDKTMLNIHQSAKAMNQKKSARMNPLTQTKSSGAFVLWLSSQCRYACMRSVGAKQDRKNVFPKTRKM